MIPLIIVIALLMAIVVILLLSIQANQKHSQSLKQQNKELQTENRSLKSLNKELNTKMKKQSGFNPDVSTDGNSTEFKELMEKYQNLQAKHQKTSDELEQRQKELRT